jgi:hypothetical protein
MLKLPSPIPDREDYVLLWEYVDISTSRAIAYIIETVSRTQHSRTVAARLSL